MSTDGSVPSNVTPTTHAEPTATDIGSPAAVATTTPVVQKPPPSGKQAITIAGGSTDPPTLDPAIIRDADSAFYARQVFRGLVKLTTDLKPAPDLSEKIDISSDQLTYTFHLREGLKFSSGKAITAADVQYSLNRATDPSIGQQAGGAIPALTFLTDIVGVNERASGNADHISGVKVVDDHTLTITLTHAVADFLVKLASTPASVVDPSDVAKGGEWWRSPDASGPFTISSWQVGSQIVLSGNQKYIVEPPTLQTVTILFGVTAGDPFTLYERNQVAWASVPSDAVDRVQASNSPYRGQLVVQSLLATSYILLNPNMAPFDDINVRKALIMAFDRTKIATVTYDGHVQALNGIVPPGLDDTDWSANVPAYDPEAAKTLLQQTSLANGGSGVIVYTSGEYAPVAMKLQLKQNLGLDSDVVQLEFSDYLSDITAHRLPATTESWVADYPDPEDFLRALFYSTSSENSVGYNNPEVDKLLDQALAAPDKSKRDTLYKQAQQKIIDDAVVIPLYADTDYELVQPYVHGLEISPVGILGLESVWVTK
ncbi:MAG: peptide ABC transporter substrate-binding protein [Nitrolancea sp.]